VVRVFADAQPTSFTFYEDDGATLTYDTEDRPLYHHRATGITQRQDGAAATVTIHPALDANGAGHFAGAVTNRANVVRLVVQDAEATAVTLNGTPLTQVSSEEAFRAASSGWFNAAANLILAKSQPMDVYGSTKTFAITLRPLPHTSSVHFACDKGFTAPGESVYAVGSIPALGAWNTALAVKLSPNVYYEYIWNPPPAHNGPGPSAPVWTGVVSGLPVSTRFEKCIRRREDGTGTVDWEAGENNVFTTSASGYSGSAYGSF
jgi:Starch binding domain/Domain of unknown function (DUF5110)